METNVLNYRILITPEKHEGRTVYNALCPALGVADFGNSIELAKKHIQGAIECYLESLMKDGEPIPAPDLPDVTIATTTVRLPHGYKPVFI